MGDDGACLALGGGGVADLMRIEDLKIIMENLGYPAYLMTILGVAKISGVIALLAPGFTRLKEWAYAGFTFDLLGAFISHLAVKDAIADTVPPLIIWGLIMASYFLRPDSRKLISGSSTASE